LGSIRFGVVRAHIGGLTRGAKRPVDGAMNAKSTWRAMRPVDIAAVYDLSRRVHADYPEREAVLAEKLKLFPAGCFVLELDGRVCGYCFSHPWNDASPRLDAFLGALPAAPSRYFIHDVTLDAGARGHGHTAALVPVLAGMARDCGVPYTMLVAVNGAEGFWARFGFRVADEAAQMDMRTKYGPRAVLMERAS
jgi:GNAT superfamily N-acetyltransferase